MSNIPTTEEIARVTEYLKAVRCLRVIEIAESYAQRHGPTSSLCFLGEAVDASWPSKALLGLLLIKMKMTEAE